MNLKVFLKKYDGAFEIFDANTRSWIAECETPKNVDKLKVVWFESRCSNSYCYEKHMSVTIKPYLKIFVEAKEEE